MTTMMDIMSREEFRKEYKEMKLEMEIEKTSLKPVSLLIAQWRAFLATGNARLKPVIDDLELTIQCRATDCWGEDTFVNFDRDFHTVTVRNSDGRILEL